MNKNFVLDAKTEVEALIRDAFAAAEAQGKLQGGQPLPAFTVEIPADSSHGDFATNAAMVSAKTFRSAPVKIAGALVECMDFSKARYIDRAEIAGPGFINFFVSPVWFADIVAGVLEAGDDYGRSDYGKGEKVMVEFVSANPTGPMHMGNARGGAIGDCLAAAMDACGYDVTREFYINDAGNQIEKFGLSLEARYLQIFKGEEAVPFPEDGYHGEDIKERAQQYADIHGDSLLNCSEQERRQALVDFALPKNIEKLRTDLEKYRITYDVWFPESTLHQLGAVKAVVDELTQRGMTYEKDGAIWYKATQFGGEKDEVLVRANGNPTYFTADIAYHRNKFVDRHFDRVINVWGADHHGHVARLKGAMDAIGLDGSKLDIVLMQLVKLLRDGEVVRMSKRTGKAISLSDLLDEVSVDAARYFFNSRASTSPLDFDLDLAVREDSENPVYYVQYAHARICSVFANALEQGYEIPNREALATMDLSPLNSKAAEALIGAVAEYPNTLRLAARDHAPHILCYYLKDLAAAFHAFYNAERVLVDDAVERNARLALLAAARQVLANGLALLGISAPERMARRDDEADAQ